jgi:MFS family permease
MLEARWFSLSQGGWLASINYLGYLVGSLALARIHPGSHEAARRWVCAGGLATAALILLMGLDLPFWLAAVVRFSAGLASAVLMVFGAIYIMEISRAPSVVGALFGGVGSGILLGGEFSQLLLRQGFGPGASWILCGVLAAALALYLCMLRFDKPEQAHALAHASDKPVIESFWLVLVLAYGLSGYGYIINTTYLPVIVKAMLGDSLIQRHVWSLVGLTAVPSCLVWLWWARRYGTLPVLVWNMVVEALGIVLSALWSTSTGVLVSAVLLGFTFMPTVALALMLGRSVPHPRRLNIVALLSGVYGIGQIAGPLAAVWLHAEFASFTPAILSAALALLLGALMLGWSGGLVTRSRAQLGAGRVL